MSALAPFLPEARSVQFEARKFLTLPTSVLTIDDDSSTNYCLGVVLEQFFEQVDSIESASEALEVLQVKFYDLIFLDLCMPEMDGLDVLQKIRSRGIYTPVVFLSGHITPDVTLKAFELGVIDLLAKPPTPDDIRRVVNDLLQRFSLGNPPACDTAVLALNEAKKLLHRCRFAKARAALEALFNCGLDTEVRVLLALTCEVLGDFVSAEQHYKEAIKLLHARNPATGYERKHWLEHR